MRLTRRRGNDGGAPDEGRDDDRNGRGGRSRARAGREVPTEVDVEEIDEPMVPAREFGPYDLSEAPPDERGLLDLGALRVPAVAGVEVHLSAGPDGRVQQVVLAHEGSRLQLGAFAAPRTEGIWDEVRESLRDMLQANGGAAEGGRRRVRTGADRAGVGRIHYGGCSARGNRRAAMVCARRLHWQRGPGPGPGPARCGTSCTGWWSTGARKRCRCRRRCRCGCPPRRRRSSRRRRSTGRARRRECRDARGARSGENC